MVIKRVGVGWCVIVRKIIVECKIVFVQVK